MQKNINELLDKTKIFLLDLDGTIYLGNNLIGDIISTLKKLREKNKKIVYFTNNSSKSVNDYKQKFIKLGFYENGDFVYTSSLATIKFLQENYKGKNVYLLGTDSLKKEFIDCGISIVEENPEICVLAYDTTITFEKIKKFNEFIVQGKKYIATHPDIVCPTEDIFMPDVGSFIEMFRRSSGKKPDIIIGKPNKIMGEIIAKDFNVKKSEVAIVGDRLHTDIKFANKCGFNSVLVLSGETNLEMVKNAKYKPKFILNSLNDIVKFI